MELSQKAVRFVIEALEHYQTFQDERLKEEKLSEDETSDLTNDRQYVEEIKQEFKRYHEELTCRRGRAKADA